MVNSATSLHSKTSRSPTGIVAVWAFAALGLVSAAVADADVPIERVGQVELLPSPFGPHWLWVSDALLERVALVDLDSGEFLGQINAGYGVSVVLFSS